MFTLGHLLLGGRMVLGGWVRGGNRNLSSVPGSATLTSTSPVSQKF